MLPVSRQITAVVAVSADGFSGTCNSENQTNNVNW